MLAGNSSTRPGSVFDSKRAGAPVVGQTTGQGRAVTRLQWLPVMDRGVVEQFGLHGRPQRFLLGLAGLFAIFTFPPITRLTHVGAISIAVLWLVLASWMMIVHTCCYRRALESRAAFNALVFGNVAAGMTINLALVLLGRTPETPLWLGYCVMACINGATESQPSILLGACHVIAPFAATPFFLAFGTSYTWALVGPLICTLASGYGYQFLARRGQLWRQERHDRECTKRSRGSWRLNASASAWPATFTIR